jgi:hypothetical protein
MTPVELIAYAHKLDSGELGDKLRKRITDATGLPLVASLAFFAMGKHSNPVTIRKLSNETRVEMSPSSLNALYTKCLIDKAPNTSPQEWVLSREGVIWYCKAEAKMQTLVKILTKKKEEPV